ncbi:hypothetical protein, partial [Salmonella enterica]|uniref:hypothetical protein n=1 Tax=Salmonella enterica TaxID=28901 RepID=UPI0006473528
KNTLNKKTKAGCLLSGLFFSQNNFPFQLIRLFLKLNDMAPKEYKKADAISSVFFTHDPFVQLVLRSCAGR